LPRLAASQCDGQQEGGSWLESHGKCLCTTTRIQWCFPRGCDDTITIAFIKDAIEQFAAVLLAFIGAFYVGFGLQTGTRAQIITEWTVALGFFGAAMVGLWVTPWIVPAAYVVHGFWITRIIKIQGSRPYLRGIHHYVPYWIGWQRRF
jgi:hypothetical protein